MKTTLLALALAAINFAAFAQGKVTFGNDANHLIILGGYSEFKYPGLYPGLAAPQVGTPKDVMSSLTAQLWAGKSPGSLTLQSTLNPAGLAGIPDGRLATVSVTLRGIAGGETGFFQIRLFETSAGSYAQAANGFFYWCGFTPIIRGTAGGFAPTPLTSMTDWTGPIFLTVSLEMVPIDLVPIGRIGNEFRFSFNAVSYRTYTVEYTDSLATANWVTLTNIPPGSTSGTIQISDTSSADERYYRVRTP